jgi:hypothetical protein
MSLWRGLSGAGRSTVFDLPWACATYLDLLAGNRVQWILGLLVLPALFIISGSEALAQDSLQPAWGTLIAALLVTLVPALALLWVGETIEAPANESHFFQRLHDCGLDEPALRNAQWPVLGMTPLLRLVYQTDLAHFPASRHDYTSFTYTERRMAWSMVNTALRAYYRECLRRGLAPVRLAELQGALLLHLIALASLVLLGVAALSLPREIWAAGELLLTRLPLEACIAALALYDCLILVVLRTEMRVAAFIRALQAHLMAHSAEAAHVAEAAPGSAEDNGWG